MMNYQIVWSTIFSIVLFGLQSLPVHAETVSAETAFVKLTSENLISPDEKYALALQLTLTNLKIDSKLERFESVFDIIIGEGGSIDEIVVYSNDNQDMNSTINAFNNNFSANYITNEISFSAVKVGQKFVVAERPVDNILLASICNFLTDFGPEILLTSGLENIEILTLSSCPFLNPKIIESSQEASNFELLDKNIKWGNAPGMGSDVPDHQIFPKTIREAQIRLFSLGYNPGRIDGINGRLTSEAVSKFYFDRGEYFDGNLDENEFLDLQAYRYRLGDNYVQNFTIQLAALGAPQTIEIREYANIATIIQGVGVSDIFNEGQNRIFLCSTTYTNWDSHPVVVLSLEDSQLVDSTEETFGIDVPTTNQCTAPLFADLNADGLIDIVYSEAGQDEDPWAGTSIEIALNDGALLRRLNGDPINRIEGIRSYSTAVGNIDSDPFGEILLSSGTDASKSVVLHFNADDISVKLNPFFVKDLWGQSLNSTNLQVADFDNDGRNDLFIGGNWAMPSSQIAWSGLSANRFSKLPNTPMGFYKGNFYGNFNAIGADITTTAVADFDNDGDLDIVSVYEEVTQTYLAGSSSAYYGNSNIQVLENRGNRKFSIPQLNFTPNMGHRYYLYPIVYDLNNDGKLDLVLNYWDKLTSWSQTPSYGSTILMNIGDLKFQRIDSSAIKGAILFDGTNWMQDVDYTNRIGMLFPIKSINEGTVMGVIQAFSGTMNDTHSGRKYSRRRLVNYVANMTFHEID